MDRQVRKYIQSCDICQRVKPSNSAPGGLLEPLPIPNKAWESISMDFITHLPTTKDGYDAIFVVVDRLTKYAHFIPTTSSITALDTAKIFIANIFKLHGIPKSIISDRDPRFTSEFWKTLFKLLGTDLRMSTSNHPQSDGQTERTNRTLEQMIRATTGYMLQEYDSDLASL